MTQHERLLFLLNALINELPHSEQLKIPILKAEQEQLLRSLMNVRKPYPASEAFLRIQNDYLQEKIQSKGIVDAENLPLLQEKLCLWQGDITTLKCGAIVNAANSAMLGCFIPCHSCIDNAIYTYAGIQLRAECNTIMQWQGHQEAVGQAKLTKAYNLPCDYILHTVGPVVKGSLTQKHCNLLSSCYQACLTLAEENKIKSIAFCCISTGEFHFPRHIAAEIAVNTVKEFLKNSTIERVIFNVFKDADREIYEKLLC